MASFKSSSVKRVSLKSCSLPRVITSLVLCQLLVACQQPASPDVTIVKPATEIVDMDMNASHLEQQETELLKKMQWLHTADPIKDANSSVQNMTADNKAELIAFSQRMLSFPGLTTEQYEQIKETVNYKIAAGSGDMIFGEEHHQMQGKLFTYAEIYNKTIFNQLTAP